MKNESQEIALFTKLFSLFKRKRKVVIGDIGIYHDTLSYNPVSNSTRSIQYDIYLKVRAVEVYDDLVEVDVMNTMVSESVSEEISNLIKSDSIKYLKPNEVKWKIQ